MNRITATFQKNSIKPKEVNGLKTIIGSWGDKETIDFGTVNVTFLDFVVKRHSC